MTVLAKPKIIELRTAGHLLIEPFDERNVKNSSYDVSLGHYYWRERRLPSILDSKYQTNRDDWVTSSTDPTCQTPPDAGATPPSILNMYSEESVRSMWTGSHRAAPLDYDLPGIPRGTPVIVIGPGENLLCHTHEFIGTTDLINTTMMKAKSSIGRNRITIALCAGWGDVGFANRWCLEVWNCSGYRSTILVPERPIGQVVFMATTGLTGSQDSYFASGKYQTQDLKGQRFAQLEDGWKPESLLPQMWKDYPQGPK